MLPSALGAASAKDPAASNAATLRDNRDEPPEADAFVLLKVVQLHPFRIMHGALHRRDAACRRGSLDVHDREGGVEQPAPPG